MTGSGATGFHDFLERRAGRWGVMRRQPIDEKDRMYVVDPAGSVTLDQELLGRFPVGYRHLAYLQERIGHRCSTAFPA